MYAIVHWKLTNYRLNVQKIYFRKYRSKMYFKFNVWKLYLICNKNINRLWLTVNFVENCITLVQSRYWYRILQVFHHYILYNRKCLYMETCIENITKHFSIRLWLFYKIKTEFENIQVNQIYLEMHNRKVLSFIFILIKIVGKNIIKLIWKNYYLN